MTFKITIESEDGTHTVTGTSIGKGTKETFAKALAAAVEIEILDMLPVEEDS